MDNEKQLLTKIINNKQNYEPSISIKSIKKIIDKIDKNILGNEGPYKNRYQERVNKSKILAYNECKELIKNLI